MGFNLRTFMDLGPVLCQQQDKPELAIGLFQLTVGDPCTTGCAWFWGGNCPGYKKLIQNTNTPKENPFVKTNQQIADKLNISKRQVAKLRKTGELSEVLDRFKKN